MINLNINDAKELFVRPCEIARTSKSSNESLGYIFISSDGYNLSAIATNTINICKKSIHHISEPFCAYFNKSDEEQSVSSVTRHPVIDGVIKHGEYVSVKEVSGILSSMHENLESNAELIPNNVIFNSEAQLIWYVKAKKQDMWI